MNLLRRPLLLTLLLLLLLVAPQLPGADQKRSGSPKAVELADARRRPVASDFQTVGKFVVAMNKSTGVRPDDWAQWGGSSMRNNVPDATNIPAEWNIGGFDNKTGKWLKDKAENIKWTARLGSQSYGNPVIANGKVYLGSNNGAGYLKRYPAEVDLGVLLCFNEADGKFLWQQSNEKLPTGRVHDWPLQGICSTPLVEGDRLWVVTNRGEVLCLDTDGFHDGEDDGPVKNEFAKLFEISSVDDPSGLKTAIQSLKQGTLSDDLQKKLAAAGVDAPAGAAVTKTPQGFAMSFASKGGSQRQIKLVSQGPKLIAYKVLSPEDVDEADVVWRLDMMKQLGISQHNMCSCSVTAAGNRLFVNTSNGVDEGHINIPAPHAPSFMAVDKNTGKVLWTDGSPGINVLHGQWSSPTYAVLGGVPQVLFGGGDGWLYSFDPAGAPDGKSKLLWKFDCNPKESKYVLGGRADRNHIIGTPMVYEERVYVAVGEDPEHGEGVGHLWCIDPTKRGDVSPELAFNVSDLKHPIPHRRNQAVIKEQGEVARPNPNSAAVWHYGHSDQNGNGKVEFEETMHRTCGTAAIKDGLLFIADFSGLVHCLDAKKGTPYWTYDMLAAAWSSPLIADGKVYIGDEDGQVAVFRLAPKLTLVAENDMGNSVYSTPVVANGILFISNKDHLFAIKSPAQ